MYDDTVRGEEEEEDIAPSHRHRPPRNERVRTFVIRRHFNIILCTESH